MTNSGTKAPAGTEPTRNPTLDVGHYFEQAVFETSFSMQEMRAATKACLRELERLGVSTDQETGVTTITATATTSPAPGD